ncbi:unnamed protein product [Toxocara canis]|uniref:SH3 domain-containing protein n=1 Tax=Toxocara canis TaxID=6265 RepID=A0A183UN30_TOXCA|nr:unnamed protein product [Toxocara canis]
MIGEPFTDILHGKHLQVYLKLAHVFSENDNEQGNMEYIEVNGKEYCWFGWIPYQMRGTHWKKIEFDGPQQIL